MKTAASILMCVVLGAPALVWAQDAEVDPPPPPPPRHTYGAPIQAPILHRHLAAARHTAAAHNPSRSKRATPSAAQAPSKTNAHAP